MDSFRVFGVFRGDYQLSTISYQLFRATLIRGWCFSWERLSLNHELTAKLHFSAGCHRLWTGHGRHGG